MRRKLLLLFFLVFWISACTEHVDTSARYVFRDKTIVDYLASHDEYSQYLELLGEVPVSRASKTTLRQLLSARGHYTAFAPTNDAINSFLIELSQRDSDLMSGPRWEDFYSERKRDSVTYW